MSKEKNGKFQLTASVFLENSLTFFSGTALALILGRKLYYTCVDPFEQRIIVALYADHLIQQAFDEQW